MKIRTVTIEACGDFWRIIVFLEDGTREYFFTLREQAMAVFDAFETLMKMEIILP